MMRSEHAYPIGIIGAGHMASALLNGFLQAGMDPSYLWVCDHNAEKLSHWEDQGLHTATDIEPLCLSCEALILAVRPNQIMDLMMDIQRFCDHHVEHPSWLVSLAAGISIDHIAPFVPQAVSTLRAMPNIPVQINAGCTTLYAFTDTPKEHTQACQALFEQVGSASWLDDEAQMHVATSVCGSGPAFLLRWMETLENKLLDEGVCAQDAKAWVTHTVLGTARWALNSDDDLATLGQQITSPGGVTEKGLAVLEASDIDGIMQDTLEAAMLHSKAIDS